MEDNRVDFQKSNSINDLFDIVSFLSHKYFFTEKKDQNVVKIFRFLLNAHVAQKGLIACIAVFDNLMCLIKIDIS